MKSESDRDLTAFAQQIQRPEDEIDLARTALVMGRFEYPDLDVAGYMQRIDQLASVAVEVTVTADVPALTLAQYLFDTMGFAGNGRNYADPRNSFLNEVLERRLGVPISLSVLYLEVARRAGIDAAGVGLPGHFIVRAQTQPKSDQGVYLDPFHNGIPLTEKDCRERVHQITNGKLPFNDAFLNPVGSRYILARMLNNLKNYYTSVDDYPRTAKVIERLLVVHPDDPTETRNLGLIYGSLGKKRQAAELLEKYLTAHPNAHDVKAVRQQLDALTSAASRWN